MFLKKKQKKKNAPVSTHTHPHHDVVHTSTVCVQHCSVRTVFYYFFEKKAVENMIIRNHKSHSVRVVSNPRPYDKMAADATTESIDTIATKMCLELQYIFCCCNCQLRTVFVPNCNFHCCHLISSLVKNEK